MRTLAWILALSAAFVAVGCASTSPTRPPAGPVQLTVRGQPNDVTTTRNLSVARTRKYEDGQLLRDGAEAVEFTVRTRVTGVDPAGRVSTEVTTSAKEGTVPLVELAFPEPGESLTYVTAPDGTILRAGDHAPSTLFFIPALPLPDHPVAVDDTWSFDHEWRSAQGGLPLRLELTGILKGLIPCGPDRQTCADVEISGRVHLLARANSPGTRFDSRVRGRALFSIARGEVRWSEMRSREEFINGAKRAVVDSCMTSRATTEGDAVRLKCEPGADVAITVPGER